MTESMESFPKQEPVQQEKPPQKESILNLPPQEREVVRARIASSMEIVGLGGDYNDPWPVHLSGNTEQATALIDLLQAGMPDGKFGMVLEFTKPAPGLSLDKKLLAKLQGPVVVVNAAQGESGVLHVSNGEKDGVVVCKIGYSAKGTSIEGGLETGKVAVNMGNDRSELIRAETLFKLYQLTGNPKFMQYVGQEAAHRSEQGTSTRSEKPKLDPKGYYTALGLNPYALRSMSEEMFENIVAGIKKEIVKKMHPDTGAQTTQYEKDAFDDILKAVNILESKEKRDAYSSPWMKNTAK